MPRRKNSTRSALSRRLQDMLLDEGYRAGEQLPTEAQLVERFECSRSSLREALKQLQALGLVEIRRGMGTHVGPMSVGPLFDALAVATTIRSRSEPEAFSELVQTRAALDIGMAEPICQRFKGTYHEELESIVEQMGAVVDDNQRFADLDRRFHYEIQSAVGNTFASDLVANFWDVYEAMELDERYGRFVSVAESAAQHRAVLDAAYEGDPDKYKAAIYEHYEGSRRQAEAFARSHSSHSD